MMMALFTQNTSESRLSAGPWKHGASPSKMSHGVRMMAPDDLHRLDGLFQEILSGLSAAGINKTARAVGQAVRAAQQKRIRSQQSPDGNRWPARKKRVFRVQAGVVFIWNGTQVRRLKNWRTTTGRYGPVITGYDTDRRGIRS
ncbi:phage virion morphogenesis protein, partial [Escherichia coli]|nr:phage virion morphogenesis protein [Escherichia coli]